MAILLSVMRSQVDGLISADDDILSQIRRDWNIKSAVEEFSRDLPDEETGDVSGDGGRYYPLTGGSKVLTNWVSDFSHITDLEYPADTIASDETPVYLEKEDWRSDYWASSVQYLFLPNHTPAATETMRITFAVPWLWSASSVTTAVNKTAHGFSVDDYLYLDGTDWNAANDARLATHQVTAVADVDNFTAAILQTNIPQEQFFNVCYLAASICCQAIADRYAQIGDSTLNVDSASHTTKSTEFATRAGELRELYRQGVGLDDETGGAVPAGEFVDWDTEPSTGGAWLFHRRG